MKVIFIQIDISEGSSFTLFFFNVSDCFPSRKKYDARVFAAMREYPLSILKPYARDVVAISIECGRRIKVRECARKRIVQGARRVVRHNTVFPILF